MSPSFVGTAGSHLEGHVVDEVGIAQAEAAEPLASSATAGGIEWAASGGVKIERAKEHVRSLEADIKAFLERSPYRVVRENDYEAGKVIYRAHIPAEPPLRLGAIAGDILHNLRSSLDILWRNVWYPAGGGLTNRRLEFPIYETSEGLEARYPKNRFVKSRTKAAVNLLYEIAPYKGGNDLLWMLHEANAADKHRLLIPAYVRVQYPVLEFEPVDLRPLGIDIPSFNLEVSLGEDLCPVKDGTEVFRATLMDDPTHMQMNFQFPLDIAFGECEPIKGKPILSLLHQFTGEVERVAQIFLTARLLR
jgi:hypothetical protein